MHPLLYNLFYLADAHGLRGELFTCDRNSWPEFGYNWELDLHKATLF